MHPCTWTIPTPSGRMRIQSAAPGRKAPSNTGPTKRASSKRQLIRNPSDSAPTTSLRSWIVQAPRNLASHGQRAPSADPDAVPGGDVGGLDRRRRNPLDTEDIRPSPTDEWRSAARRNEAPAGTQPAPPIAPAQPLEISARSASWTRGSSTPMASRIGPPLTRYSTATL